MTHPENISQFPQNTQVQDSTFGGQTRRYLQAAQQLATAEAGGIDLVISISSRFHPGDAKGPQDQDLKHEHLISRQYQDPSRAARTWFAHHFANNITALLDLWDEFGIKITSHMTGEDALANPRLAGEIAQRGHEIALLGLQWHEEYELSPAEERRRLEISAKTIRAVTGVQPKGHQAHQARINQETLTNLAKMEFEYHVDHPEEIGHMSGLSFSEKPALHIIQSLNPEEAHAPSSRDSYSEYQFFQQLMDDFRGRYSTASKNSQIMSISLDDAICGTPGMLRALRRFLGYVSSQKGVRFANRSTLLTEMSVAAS